MKAFTDGCDEGERGKGNGLKVIAAENAGDEPGDGHQCADDKPGRNIQLGATKLGTLKTKPKKASGKHGDGEEAGNFLRQPCRSEQVGNALRIDARGGEVNVGEALNLHARQSNEAP